MVEPQNETTFQHFVLHLRDRSYRISMTLISYDSYNDRIEKRDCAFLGTLAVSAQLLLFWRGDSKDSGPC